MTQAIDRRLGSRCSALVVSIALALPSVRFAVAAGPPASPEPPAAAAAAAAAAEPEPVAGEPEPEPEPNDELRLRDGTVLYGRIIEVQEGAYVTFEAVPEPTATDVAEPAPRSVPWPEIETLVIANGRAEPLRLGTTRTGLGRPSEPTPDAPWVELVGEGDRPTTLAALRGQKIRGSSRYRIGFTIECRAPCRQVIDGKGRTFFVETDPWITSRMFTLPPKADGVRIHVKPGNRDMRIAGAAFLGLAAAGVVVGTTLLAAVDPRRRVLFTTGLTWVSLSPVFVLTGGILMGLGRTRVDVAPMGLGALVQAKRKRRSSRSSTSAM